jgi:hypothetical protein
LFSSINAQPVTLIEDNYDGLIIKDFELEIQKKYDVTFYNRPFPDTLRIIQRSQPLDLSTILEETLKKTKYDFIMIGQQIAYLTNKVDKREITLETYQVDTLQSQKKDNSYVSNNTVEKEKNRSDPSTNHVITIGKASQRYIGKKATLSGIIREQETNDPLVGATVYVKNLDLGVVTNFSGSYSLTLPKGRHQISFQSLGKETKEKNLLVYSDGKFDIELRDKITQLKGVVIKADRNSNVASTRMGMEKLTMTDMKEIPTVMGEADVMKVAILLPGVQTVGEAASGFNVRGGNIDQNLVLYNDAPVFNTSHLFGFFSAFNPDVLKEFELYKSGIPAQYGGRLSSVFDVKTKNGNKKEFAGNIGISPVTGKLMIETPLIVDESSLIVGGRSTYSNWILKRINDPDISSSEARFYDITAKLDLKINDKNYLDFSVYNSGDWFNLASDTTFEYHNTASTLNWKRNINDKTNLSTSLIYSNYNYTVSSDLKPLEAFTQTYELNLLKGKADVLYYPTFNHSVKFGFQTNLYKLDPGTKKPLGSESIVVSQSIAEEKAQESAIYIGDKYRVNSRLSVYAGLRFSFYSYLGPSVVYQYDEMAPKQFPSTVIDSNRYSNNDFVKNYGGPELRFYSRYMITDLFSVKIGYNRMRQYLHMLTNTTSMSPTDIWKLSDPHIKPQYGDQYSVGFYKNFRYADIETSIEGYYKDVNNLLDFKGGADINMNPDIETEVLAGKGKAYGVECLIKKKQGKLTGWISYTYSRSFLKVDSEFESEKINNGDFFPTNFDKPHDLTVVSNYKFNRRLSISSNWTYSTGRPITYPVASYRLGSLKLLEYSDRNQYRIPDYFRWDISVKLEGNLKRNKLVHSSWIFSVYNLTGRDNVYSIFFNTYGGDMHGYKMSIFAQPIPTLTLNFRF